MKERVWFVQLSCFVYLCFFLEVYQNTRTAKLLHLEKAPKERYKIVKMIWFCKLFPFSGFTPQTKLPASKNHQFSGFLNLESRNIDEISDIFHIASQDCFFVAAASVFYREKISVQKEDFFVSKFTPMLYNINGNTFSFLSVS